MQLHFNYIFTFLEDFFTICQNIFIQSNMNSGYIAVIDSGIGGISVLKSLIKELPNEHYLYFGDNFNAPYGNKSKSQLRLLTFNNLQYLKQFPIKALVVACGTLSTTLLNDIRQFSELPTFGVYPPVESALAHGEKTLLLSTRLTAKQYVENQLLTVVGLRGLASEIEYKASDLSKVDFCNNILTCEDYERIKNKRFDTVILGCTHYFFVKNQIFDHFRPQKITSGDHFTVKMVKKYLQKVKSLGKYKRFQVDFIGDSAKFNQEFFIKSGQCGQK